MDKWRLRHEVRLNRKSRIAYAQLTFATDYLPSVHSFFDIAADRVSESSQKTIKLTARTMIREVVQSRSSTVLVSLQDHGAPRHCLHDPQEIS